ncbi:MAG: BrnA antitoxin family protein [Azoarcus sp.]|jgi:uncharacterized protein (DUF4415 family)|nr:BrnA antitoxin family protein [Azoarcus sp.]
MQAYALGTIAPTPANAAALFTDPQVCGINPAPQQEDVTLFLDADVLDGIMATGKDWEARFNDVLRQWLKAR